MKLPATGDAPAEVAAPSLCRKRRNPDNVSGDETTMPPASTSSSPAGSSHSTTLNLCRLSCSPVIRPTPFESNTSTEASTVLSRCVLSSNRSVLHPPLADGVPKGLNQLFQVHPVNGEVPPVKGRPWKLPHYANRGKTSSSGGELASARSCFSTVRTALGKLRITGLLAQFDRSEFSTVPTASATAADYIDKRTGNQIWDPESAEPRPHLPIYRMTPKGLNQLFQSLGAPAL